MLYQNDREQARYDLKKPQDLADLLNQFFSYTEPEHDNFKTAVEGFKERVPQLAVGRV